VVLAVRAEVRLPVVESFLGRLVASGPPKLVGCFGRRLLRRTVAAFSTFSLVCVVLIVRRELVVRFRVSLAPELESSSQSSVSVMVRLVVVLKKQFRWRRNSTAGARRKNIRSLDEE
jgi:hypothetical protein